jgi:DNA-binding NarL/FixJ family response regulator
MFAKPKRKNMKTLILSRKKSGNYTINTYADQAWEVVATCQTPAELLQAVRALPKMAQVIKAEYSQSQLKCSACYYTDKDALRAFGLSVSKANLSQYFPA